MKTLKNSVMTITLICLLVLTAAAQDPGTMGPGSDKTQPPPPPPPVGQTSTTGVTAEPEADLSLWVVIVEGTRQAALYWLGVGVTDGQQ